MLKYVTVAATLKLFSTCSPMKNLYRILGNTLGSEKRLKSNIPDYYIDRINRMLNLCKKHDLIKHGDKLLELGTGWLHWEATTIRLFFDIQAILFDVWDNRQFAVFKKYLSELKYNIHQYINIDSDSTLRIYNLFEAMLLTCSFDDLYNLLGFEYIIEPTGKLNGLEDESFDVIVSAAVLEHIKRDYLSECVNEFYRLLKPGGYSIHSINISDHLHAYDKSVSLKNYLKFSDEIWQHCFENDVQYFNRVQKSEWIDLFNGAGLKLIDEQSSYTNIEGLNINSKYRNLDKHDLACISLNIVHRKPCYS